MINTVRNIATGLLVSGLFLLTAVATQQMVQLCGQGTPNCLVAAVTFGVTAPEVLPMQLTLEQSQSTIAVSANEPSMASLFVEVVQVMSIYLILISVIMLVVLELYELRYLRRLVARH